MLRYSIAQPQILHELERHLDTRVHSWHELEGAHDTADMEVETPRGRFLIEYKYTGSAPLVTRAVLTLKHALQQRSGDVPLVVVPFMGETGREICRESGVSWMDLSGNAEVAYRSVKISVLGRPNRYKHSGVPSNLFAPKSSRISRVLLLNPDRAFTQSEIVAETGLDPGQVSKLVRALEREELVRRSEGRRIRVADPDVLLDAWAEGYRFRDHHILRGHIATRSSIQLAEELSGRLRAAGIRHAATGLAAAWRYAPHASHRIVTFYVDQIPAADWLDGARFRPDEEGGNIWLVIPKDAGVFMGTADRGGVPCVSPIQVYLDLQAHPERAREAADELRRSMLTWSTHG